MSQNSLHTLHTELKQFREYATDSDLLSVMIVDISKFKRENFY